MSGVNATNQIPNYCKNCLHRIPCGIQDVIRKQDADVSKFNTDNVGTLQTVASINYNCRYKLIDPSVTL